MASQRLRETVRKTPILDTHEHIPPCSSLLEGLNIFGLLGRSYLKGDLVSAGMPPEAWGGEGGAWQVEHPRSPEQIWQALKPALRAVEDSGFYSLWCIVLRDLYQVPRGKLTDDNWEAISENVRQNYQQQDWVEKVLRHKAQLAASILDNYWQIEAPRLPGPGFHLALRANTFIYGPAYRQTYTANTTVERMSESWNVPIDTVDGYFELWEKALEVYSKKNLRALKLAVAYERDMAFEPVSEADLRTLYPEVLSEKSTPHIRRRFQDGMVHRICASAADRSLPVQVHTGLQAGNKNFIKRTDPTPLNSLFGRYPEVKFSLLHVGYPYVDEAIALAKMFPNVYLDLAWHGALSPYLVKDTLKKLIGTVPANKLTWGADAHVVEEAYGASVLLRRLLQETLGELMEERGISESRACELAEMILRENARNLFGIGA